MTVLGDLAQATAPGAPESWEAAIAHLGAPPSGRRADLDLGYRVPASIMDMANRLLAEAAPGVTPCRSVRTGGREPTFLAVDGVGPDGERGQALAAAVRDAAAELVAAWSTVGVIVPPALRPAVDREVGGLAGTTVLAPPEAKGLEFDAVVVVEPAELAGATARGLRLLYVALTRAVQELVVVHARPLPAGLGTPA
jgi:DNA helicase IV